MEFFYGGINFNLLLFGQNGEQIFVRFYTDFAGSGHNGDVAVSLSQLGRGEWR